MEIRPLYDRIVVKRAEARTQTESGLHLPGKGEVPMEGIVLAVGDGIPSEVTGEIRPLITKKGDRVLFNKYAGAEINIEGEEHLIIREDDVLGIVTTDAD